MGIADLNIVLGNWNEGTPPADVVVPEPANAVLFTLTVAGALRRDIIPGSNRV